MTQDRIPLDAGSSRPMSETIPEDVMQAARKTATAIAAGVIGNADAAYVEREGAKEIARALMAQRTRQEERVRVLEEALRPFADEFRRLEKNYVGFEIMFTDDVVYVGGKLTIGHLRRAALGNGGGDA